MSAILMQVPRRIEMFGGVWRDELIEFSPHEIWSSPQSIHKLSDPSGERDGKRQEAGREVSTPSSRDQKRISDRLDHHQSTLFSRDR
jgi:hypothetical protein